MCSCVVRKIVHVAQKKVFMYIGFFHMYQKNMVVYFKSVKKFLKYSCTMKKACIQKSICDFLRIFYMKTKGI